MSDHSALFIVDVQKGFVTEHSSHIIAPIEAIQHRFDHVLASRFYNPDPSPFRRLLDYHKCSKDTEEVELACQLRKDAIVFDKPHYSSVTRESLHQLREWHADEVYLCGIATEACVLKTAADLFENGIRCFIMSDLCASDQGEPYHGYAIELLRKLLGDKHIIDSSDVRRQLAEGSSRTC